MQCRAVVAVRSPDDPTAGTYSVTRSRGCFHGPGSSSAADASIKRDTGVRQNEGAADSPCRENGTFPATQNSRGAQRRRVHRVHGHHRPVPSTIRDRESCGSSAPNAGSSQFFFANECVRPSTTAQCVLRAGRRGSVSANPLFNRLAAACSNETLGGHQPGGSKVPFWIQFF